MIRHRRAVFFSCRWIVLISIGSAFLLPMACAPKPPGQASEPQRSDQSTGAVQAPGADDGQWVMAAKDYANTRFSGLDQINTGNVKDLKLAFTFSTGLLNGHEAAPLVVNNTMYIVTPYPNYLL